MHFSSKENVDTNFFFMVESLLIIGTGAGRNKNLEPELCLRIDRLRNTGYYQCCRELQTSTVSSSSSSFIYNTKSVNIVDNKLFINIMNLLYISFLCR